MKQRYLTIGLALLALVATACGSDASSGQNAASDAESSVSPTAEAFRGTADPSPNFSLLSTNGGAVNFADLRGTVPVALYFYGGGCEGCEEQLRLLQENYGRFKDTGAEVIAISTDLVQSTRPIVERNDIEFPVLTDVDGTVSLNWGVFNVLNNGHAAPAIVIFGPSGEEIARQVAASANELPAIDEMLQTIQRSLESGTAASTPTPPARESGVQAAGFGPGVTDFELPDAISGSSVSLGETLRDRNVVLVFYRAFW